MVPIKKNRDSHVSVPLIALGLPLAILTANTLSAGPASALVINLDSTNDGAASITSGTSSQSISNTVKMMRSFQMGTLDSYLTNLRIAYSLPFATGGTIPSLDLKVEAFKVITNSSGVYITTGASLGSFTTTLLPAAAANTPQYTADLAVGDSLASVLFESGQSYGLLFSNGTIGANAGQSIALRRCGGTITSPTPAGCLLTPVGTPTLANGGVSYLGGSRVSGTTWSNPGNIQNTLYHQYTFTSVPAPAPTPVPAPAFMGASYLGGLFLGSRRLRLRIRKSAA
jgi:hypothetical protein